MHYTNTNNKRESDGRDSFNSSYSSAKRINVLKRLLVLTVMAISLAFAGAQTAPTAKAGAPCEVVCGEPYIDPTDGQCYQECCPADPMCKSPCIVKTCTK